MILNMIITYLRSNFPDENIYLQHVPESQRSAICVRGSHKEIQEGSVNRADILLLFYDDSFATLQQLVEDVVASISKLVGFTAGSWVVSSEITMDGMGIDDLHRECYGVSFAVVF